MKGNMDRDASFPTTCMSFSFSFGFGLIGRIAFGALFSHGVRKGSRQDKRVKGRGAHIGAMTWGTSAGGTPTWALNSRRIVLANRITTVSYPKVPILYTSSTNRAVAIMMEYLRHKKAKPSQETLQVPEEPPAPLLNEDDEAFLQRIAEEGPPPPLPRRPPLPARPLDLPVVGEVETNDMQLVLADYPIEIDDPKEIPLPQTPATTGDAPPVPEDENESTEERKDKGETKDKSKKKRAKWSFLRRDSRDNKRKSQKAAATDLMGAAQGVKPPDAQPNEGGNVSDDEAKKEEDEMTSLLEQLNLAAVDNRVFSMSKESQELLNK